MNWQLVIKIAILIISIHATLSGQEMYPGDVNNNGIVNGVDFLYLTNIYDKEGSVRTDTNTTYNPITAPTWNGVFPNGVNHSFGDCNGDGKISNNDIQDGIIKNFNLQHGNIQNDNFDSSGIKGTHPTLLFVPDAANSSNKLNISVSLGDSNLPVDNFYGLTFKISFDSTHIPSETTPSGKPRVSFALANNLWFANLPTSKRHLVTTKTQNDKVETTIAVGKVDDSEEDGEGDIGEFTIITVDVDHFRTAGYPFTISDVMLIDKAMNVIPVHVEIVNN